MIARASFGPTRSHCRWIGLLAVAVAGLGCNSGITQSPRVQATLASCGQSVKGAHYTVCGHWSSMASAEASDGHLTAVGSLDSAPRPSGNHYTVQGGTFHAAN